MNKDRQNLYDYFDRKYLGGLVMNNTIIEFLNLKEDEIEIINCTPLNNEHVVDLSLKRKLYLSIEKWSTTSVEKWSIF